MEFLPHDKLCWVLLMYKLYELQDFPRDSNLIGKKMLQDFMANTLFCSFLLKLYVTEKKGSIFYRAVNHILDTIVKMTATSVTSHDFIKLGVVLGYWWRLLGLKTLLGTVPGSNHEQERMRKRQHYCSCKT